MHAERVPRGQLALSTMAMARATLTGGGAFVGLGATVCKHGAHSCVYFAVFAELQSRWKAAPAEAPPPVAPEAAASAQHHAAVPLPTPLPADAPPPVAPEAAAPAHHRHTVPLAAVPLAAVPVAAPAWLSSWTTPCAGFVAGCAAATVNNPFDVIKSRQQVPPPTSRDQPLAGPRGSRALANNEAALKSPVASTHRGSAP